MSVSIDIPIISIFAVSMSLWSFTNLLLPNLQGAHQDAQKSISIYLPLNDEVFTSLLLLLFSVSDGIVSPTLIWAFIENEYNMSTVI
jgi:hypothetical protein